MPNHIEDAYRSFAQCQGKFGLQTRPRNPNDTSQALAEITSKLTTMQDGFVKLSVGLTLVSAAVAELQRKPVQP